MSIESEPKNKHFFSKLHVMRGISPVGVITLSGGVYKPTAGGRDQDSYDKGNVTTSPYIVKWTLLVSTVHANEPSNILRRWNATGFLEPVTFL